MADGVRGSITIEFEHDGLDEAWSFMDAVERYATDYNEEITLLKIEKDTGE